MQGNLREFIRRRRHELGLTQVDIARAVGVTSPDFICLVEKGIRNLDLDRIPNLAVLLKVDPAELCRMALEEQYPTLAQALLRGKVTRSRFQHATEIDLAAERLRALPRDVRRLALNMINMLFEKEHRGNRLGEAVA